MTYEIEYKVQSKIGEILKEGRIKVKNKESSLQAQIHLEKYLKRKVIGFNKLIVISCKDDTFSNLFGKLFGNNKPFDF